MFTKKDLNISIPTNKIVCYIEPKLFAKKCFRLAVFNDMHNKVKFLYNGKIYDFEEVQKANDHVVARYRVGFKKMGNVYKFDLQPKQFLKRCLGLMSFYEKSYLASARGEREQLDEYRNVYNGLSTKATVDDFVTQFDDFVPREMTINELLAFEKYFINSQRARDVSRKNNIELEKMNFFNF